MLNANILLIVIDAQRPDSLGCYGNPVVQTPYIDGLAQGGVKFEHCSPVESAHTTDLWSFWTGLMPHKHSVQAFQPSAQSTFSRHTLLQYFIRAGYHQVLIDKTDDAYRSYVAEFGYHLTHRHGVDDNLTEDDLRILSQSDKAPCGTSEIPLKHHLIPWTTQQTIQLLERRPPGQPFFAAVSYQMPQRPMMVPEPYDRLYVPGSVVLPSNFQQGRVDIPITRFEGGQDDVRAPLNEDEWRKLIAHYWGLCSLIDAQVGTLVYYLQENSVCNETIIVYTAAQSEMMGGPGMYTRQTAMYKKERLRVPLIISFPDISDGFAIQESVKLIDLLPTLAEWADVPLAEDISGISFAPYLKTYSPLSDTAFVEEMRR